MATAENHEGSRKSDGQELVAMTFAWSDGHEFMATTMGADLGLCRPGTPPGKMRMRWVLGRGEVRLTAQRSWLLAPRRALRTLENS